MRRAVSNYATKDGYKTVTNQKRENLHVIAFSELTLKLELPNTFSLRSHHNRSNRITLHKTLKHTHYNFTQKNIDGIISCPCAAYL